MLRRAFKVDARDVDLEGLRERYVGKVFGSKDVDGVMGMIAGEVSRG